MTVHPKNQIMLGASIKDIHTLGEGGVSNNADKRRWGGCGLAVSWHPFQCSFFKRGDDHLKDTSSSYSVVKD